MALSYMVLRSFSASSKLRLSTIKFRHGTRKLEEARGPTMVIATATDGQQGVRGVVVDDFQLPLKFRRAMITEDEMEYINRGGPA